MTCDLIYPVMQSQEDDGLTFHLMRLELAYKVLVDFNEWLIALLLAGFQDKLGGDWTVHGVVLIRDGLYVKLE